jgi:hypothetical protein
MPRISPAEKQFNAEFKAWAKATPPSGPLDPTAHQPSKTDLDNAHITQLQNDKYLPQGRPWPTNLCGPTTTVNAVRLLGADVPGFRGERTADVLDKALTIATGSHKDEGTYPHQLAKIVEASGLTPVPARSVDSVLARARQGIPTVILGDANAWKGFDGRSSQPAEKGDKWGHFVTVSGYDKARGEYYIDDPGGSLGTTTAPASEIRAFKKGWTYQPDVSLVPGEGGRHDVAEPPKIAPVHSRKLLDEATREVRKTLDEHSSGTPKKSPKRWDEVAAARYVVPHGSIPYGSQAAARVMKDQFHPDRTAPNTRIAVARTAKALLGENIERQQPHNLDDLLRAVRDGHLGVVKGNPSARGAWGDEYVRKVGQPDQWATVAGYLPRDDQYIVDDPNSGRLMHVPAAEIRAFDRGAAGSNFILRKVDDDS